MLAACSAKSRAFVRASRRARCGRNAAHVLSAKMRAAAPASAAPFRRGECRSSSPLGSQICCSFCCAADFGRDVGAPVETGRSAQPTAHERRVGVATSASSVAGRRARSISISPASAVDEEQRGPCAVEPGQRPARPVARSASRQRRRSLQRQLLAVRRKSEQAHAATSS